MKNPRSAVMGVVSLFFLSVVSGLILFASPAAAGQTRAIAEENRNFSQISFQPLADYDALTLTMSGPDGAVWTQKFGPGKIPVIHVANRQTPLPDGQYQYELVATPRIDPKTRSAMAAARTAGDTGAAVKILPQPLEPLSGNFLVDAGQIVTGDAVESNITTVPQTEPVSDVVHADDVIVTGSLCVGFDCLTDGSENFGFDTIKLKENNLRIKFDDTSSTAGFPANDWQITANDSASGGANYFSIDDITGSKVPFKLTAGARSNSIFVSSTGRVGLGTSTPVLDVHIVRGDTPSLRLDQDGSSGWTAQVWDIAGNESNFFIRDVTGGSRLPFRIRPGAPTNSIYIKEDGNVGLGNASPGFPLHVTRTGANTALVVERTDGAKTYINATDAYGNFGTTTNHPLRLVANNSTRMTVNADNSLAMSNGASLTAGGVWTDASSRQLKENITDLGSEEALLALAGLSPVKYSYRSSPSENHVGFIAEDVPALVASSDRKGLSPMDIVAMLTKVVQEQQKMSLEQKMLIQDLTERIRELERR